MSKSRERIFAIKLRRSGKSIKFIAKELRVSKSTVSLWCKDLKLTPIQKERLFKNMVAAGHKGRMTGAESNKRKRENLINFYQKEGLKHLGELSSRDMLIAGTALYWAEGAKTRNRVFFSNSDPTMIKFILEWLYNSMRIKKTDLIPYIFINEIHKPRIHKVLRFWSRYIKVPLKQFAKPVFIKAKQKKKYENYDNYYGIMSLRVRKSSSLMYKINGLIDVLKNRATLPV